MIEHIEKILSLLSEGITATFTTKNSGHLTFKFSLEYGRPTESRLYFNFGSPRELFEFDPEYLVDHWEFFLKIKQYRFMYDGRVFIVQLPSYESNINTTYHWHELPLPSPMTLSDKFDILRKEIGKEIGHFYNYVDPVAYVNKQRGDD